MAYDMRFTGVLTFASEDDIEEAFEEVDELIADEDPDFLDTLDESREEWFFEDGPTLTVAVDIFGPADWSMALERLIEIVAGYAITGKVDSWYDEQPRDSYGPDADPYF